MAFPYFTVTSFPLRLLVCLMVVDVADTALAARLGGGGQGRRALGQSGVVRSTARPLDVQEPNPDPRVHALSPADAPHPAAPPLRV